MTTQSNGSKWIERIIFGIVATMLAFWAQNLTTNQYKLVETMAKVEERVANHVTGGPHMEARTRFHEVEAAIGEMRQDIREIKTLLRRQAGLDGGLP